MLQQCYVLYSNDGTYPPLISNFSGLSAYTSAFVEITINSTPVTGTTFYVYDLGVITGCTPTYTALTVSSTATTDCECYFIKIPQEIFDTTYVDCEDNLLLNQFPTGQTINICSKIYPVFDTVTNVPLTNKGTCVNSLCPNTLPTTPFGKNECDVITIFPMDAECFIVQPTSDLTNDGSATLIITGGTPPYTVFWDNGSIAPAIGGIGAGSYGATVTDFYGDFTLNTVCTLTAATTVLSAMCFYVSGVSTNLQPVYLTTQPAGVKNSKPYYQINYLANIVGFVYWDGATNTWLFCEQLDCQNGLFYGSTNNPTLYPQASSGGTYEWTAGTSTSNSMISSITGTCNPPIPVVVYPPLCLSYLLETPDKFSNISTYSSEQETLYYSGTTNGQPYWGSTGGTYTLYWQTGFTPNRWVITGFTNPIQVTNNNPVVPPLNGWQVLGTQFITNLGVTSGPCVSAATLQIQYTANNPTCTNDGSIVIQALGGLPPYQYSINGGNTFQSLPIFNNLLQGTYNIIVNDSTILTGNQTVQLNNTVSTTLYQLQFSINTVTGNLTISAPSMPPGVTITFDVVHTSTFTYAPSTGLSPLPTYQNIVTLSTTGAMPLFGANNQTNNLAGPCTSTYNPYIQNQQVRIYKQTRTMSSGQVITGTISNLILNNPTGPCQFANGTYNVQINNITMNGCTCCGAVLALTPQQNLPVA